MSEDVAENTAQANPVKWAVWSLLAVAGLVGLCIGMLQVGPINLSASALEIDPNRQADLAHGQKIYNVSCATCHGAGGRGLPHQGAPLDKSPFVHGSDIKAVILMVKQGRTADDPRSVMKLPMAAKGGYSNLTDEDLHDVVSYIRTFGQKTDDKKTQTAQAK